ncbi:hypothetical protein Scep_016622 [Stephania cephalantha]|uniref:Uncharacterized protein n=1 Tax=Stephania cephalantha TaxID=152367 RepID=A0AAP0IMY7_9MAGN
MDLRITVPARAYVHRWHLILVLLIEKELTRLLCFCWLKALGIDNILGFDWLASPATEAMIRALEVLYALGVLDEDAKLTSPIKFQVSEIPLSLICPISKKLYVADPSLFSDRSATYNIFVVWANQRHIESVAEQQ